MDDSALLKYSMLSLYNVNIGTKEVNEVRKIKKTKVPNKKRISLKLYENADWVINYQISLEFFLSY